jgi:hypothetical protein
MIQILTSPYEAYHCIVQTPNSKRMLDWQLHDYFRWKAYRREKRSPIDMLTSVIRPPPPIPWTALAAMSIPTLYDRAATKVPAKKTILATKRIGLRPKISENLAHTAVELAAPNR